MAARMVFAGVVAAAGIGAVVSARTQAPPSRCSGFVDRRRRPGAVGADAIRRGGEDRGGRRPRRRRLDRRRSSATSGFLVGPPLIGAVAGATSLRGGFLFLCGPWLCSPWPARRLAPGETVVSRDFSDGKKWPFPAPFARLVLSAGGKPRRLRGHKRTERGGLVQSRRQGGVSTPRSRHGREEGKARRAR